MTDPLTPAALRAHMETLNRYPGNDTEAWRQRAHAQQVLDDWRAWLPGLLDLVEANPNRGLAGYDADQGAALVTVGLRMSQAEAEARGLV